MTPDVLAALDVGLPGAVAPAGIVAPGRLMGVCRLLRDDTRLGFDLRNGLCGVDDLEPDPKSLPVAGSAPHVEVPDQHSSVARPGRRLTLRVALPRLTATCELPGVADGWHARDGFDPVGVRLDDWGGHPPRKGSEFPLEHHGRRCR